jgi:hypothetical protein
VTWWKRSVYSIFLFISLSFITLCNCFLYFFFHFPLVYFFSIPFQHWHHLLCLFRPIYFLKLIFLFTFLSFIALCNLFLYFFFHFPSAYFFSIPFLHWHPLLCLFRPIYFLKLIFLFTSLSFIALCKFSLFFLSFSFGLFLFYSISTLTSSSLLISSYLFLETNKTNKCMPTCIARLGRCIAIGRDMWPLTPKGLITF